MSANDEALNLDEPVRQRLAWAVRIAREAGEETLRHFRADRLEVERKGDDSPVTVADRDAERLLRQRIAERFPEDALLGEEFGATEGTSGFQWILDPIDGTKSFIHGIPLYTTLVAVLRNDASEKQEPSLGVIHAPALRETVYAAVGGGCWYSEAASEPRLATASSVRSLSEGLFLTSEVASFAKARGPEGLAAYLALQDATRLARTWGDAYGYLMVATGRAEVMVDAEMNLWDSAALKPIIEEAGGHFSDWEGTPTVHHPEAIATNKHVQEETLALTRGR